MTDPRQTSGVDSTTRGVLAATLASALVIAHLVAAKAARDALFLARFHVSVLPRMVMLGALVSLAAAVASARVMERGSPVRLLIAALGGSTGLYALEYVLIDSRPRSTAIALYMHISAIGAMIIAALWSLVNERFDPHTARREVGRIALGGSFGGVVGGIAAWLLSGVRGISPLLLLLAALNVATIAGVLVLARSGRSRVRVKSAPTESQRRPALAALRQSHYLTTLAALIALTALSSTLLDYVLSARAVARYRDDAQLVAFFALFHASVGAIAVLVQLTLTRASLEWYGLVRSVAFLPGVVLATGAVGLAIPQLWSAVLMRGSEAVVQASVFRSGYELLYTPLPRAQKRPTKMLIDIGVDRLGTVAGGALTAAVVAALPEVATRVVVALAMGVAGGALLCTARLHRGYVEELAGRLRRGNLKLAAQSVFDATTRRTLEETARVLQASEQERSGPPPQVEEPEKAVEADQPDDSVFVAQGGAGFEVAPGYVSLQLGAGAPFELGNDDALVHAMSDLRSGNAERVLKALVLPFEPELAAHVVPLLDRNEVAKDALVALRSVGDHVTGTLADALLGSRASVTVRRRIPRVLERCRTSRAVDALVQGLFVLELEVRHECALALLRLTERDHDTALPHSRILDAIEYELAEERAKSQALRFGIDPLDEEPGFCENPEARALLDVEHVMTLLALVLEREPVRLAYHALFVTNPAIRGTALEYLDNVLPERLKQRVLSLIERYTEMAPPAPRRDRAELVDELLQSRALVMPSQAGVSRRDPAR